MGEPGSKRGENALVLADDGPPWWPLERLAYDLLCSGECEAAIRLTLECEPLVRLSGDHVTLGYLLQSRVIALRLLTRFEQALAMNDELLALHRQTGSVINEAKALAEQVESLVALGRFDDAMRAMAKASIILDDADRTDRRFGPAMSCLATSASEAELYETADAAYRIVAGWDGAPCNCLFRAINHTNHADLLLEWGVRLLQVGQLEAGRRQCLRALDVVDQSLQAQQRCRPVNGRPLAMGTRAMALAMVGRHDEALALALELRPKLRPEDFHTEAALTELAIAAVLGARGETVAARAALQSAEAYGRPARSGVRLMITHIQTQAVLAARDCEGEGLQGWAHTTAAGVIHAQAVRLWELRQQRLDALEQAEAREHSEAARRSAEQAMLHDQLTGLGNRRRLEVEQRHRTLSPGTPGVTILMIDVDHFKEVNDRFSHRIGDEVLKQLAVIISSQCRNEDVPVRFGGDEFVMLVAGPVEVGLAAGERIRERVHATDWQSVAAGLSVTVSIGVAESAPGSGRDWAELFDAADERLFGAKKSGRDAVVG